MIAKTTQTTWILGLTALAVGSACIGAGSYVNAGFGLSPFACQVERHARQLRSAGTSAERARAAEALGYLRAYQATSALTAALDDANHAVRREAALALGWCGTHRHVPALLKTLEDDDWAVRQAAAVALINLTGVDANYDGLASPDERSAATAQWREWQRVADDGELLDGGREHVTQTSPIDLARGCAVTASSTYKGPPGALTRVEPGPFWQTKNVRFPQWCTVRLAEAAMVGCVVVRQHSERFCMTDCTISLSLDGSTFEQVWRRTEPTPTELVASFPPRKAHFVRVTSRGAKTPTYPTTFVSLHVLASTEDIAALDATDALDAQETRLRALGASGRENDAQRVCDALKPYRVSVAREPAEARMVRAGLRALGRVGGAGAVAELAGFLENAEWARHAADALGDTASPDAVPALLAAYPHYARGPDRKPPREIPKDDRPGFESIDRVYETAYAIAYALSRLPLDTEQAREGLQRIAPLLAANIPGDYDGAMLYEPESHQLVTAYLLEKAGWRELCCRAALSTLGQPVTTPPQVPDPALWKQINAVAKTAPGGAPYAASWLPALYRRDELLPLIVNLLKHDNGWVRINAAKTLMFIRETAVADTIAELLEASLPEAEHGYNGTFHFRNKSRRGQDEYNAPAPCWREAFTHALGKLGTARHVPLLVQLLNDSRNVLEVQAAAATALDHSDTPDAVGTLQHAAAAHPFHSIRLLAREALWRRGLAQPAAQAQAPARTPLAAGRDAGTARPDAPCPPDSLVFIRGDNIMPNCFSIDIWRQTYTTTDAGPTYRLGTNLYRLSPARPDGAVTELTSFHDGYVADCEVAWDGSRVVFARRGGDADPWWHIYEVGVDGTGLRQLTAGPHHDVQPAYLPDGRIVFSSTRIGVRDEYHGYPATGLTVMDHDGSNIRCIGFNLGRDNEPAVLSDGRIVFSRLELFYSRLKTEITVHATFPDGSRDVTLYGPERREFWRQVTRASGEKWWQESGPRHRVLRLTQVQALEPGRVLCATTGGATLLGPGRYREQILSRHNNMTVTSPFPLDDGLTAVCAATVRTTDRHKVDLGLYRLNLQTGRMTLIYNDPETAEFEPRPVKARKRPPTLVPSVGRRGYTGRLFCASVGNSRNADVRRRAKLVRIVEGQPIFSRHHTHTNSHGLAWKNHVGTHARVLGTVPLAADGSFYVEVPADRLIHCQVLDSDRAVVENQLVWMYARPGETKSCAGCHETPDTAPPAATAPFPRSVTRPPVPCLPSGGEFSYRAKQWRKSHLPPQAEERTRTVRAVSLLARQ